MADFYEMDFTKGTVKLVKADEMYNIGREMIQKWMITDFLLEICPYIYYVLPLIRGRLHLARDTAAEKEIDIAIQLSLKYVNSEIQENRNGQKQ